MPLQLPEMTWLDKHDGKWLLIVCVSVMDGADRDVFGQMRL